MKRKSSVQRKVANTFKNTHDIIIDPNTHAKNSKILVEIKFITLVYMQGRIQGVGGLVPLIFQKRPINIYNFVKKLKIYISDPS
jgi:hypothetical protein